jgi:3-deoxy-D-manno-octulosonic-acid transferase/heptosyltransferase-1
VKILIVKLSAIGDVIHTLPALNALRRHFPNAHITWLVEEGARDMVQGHPALDRVIVSGRKRWLADAARGRCADAFGGAARFVHCLRDTHYDLLLDFQASLKSGLLIALTRARRKVGFDKGMVHSEHSHVFLNERIAPVSMEIHALKRGLILLEAIGVPCGQISYELPIGPADIQAADSLLRATGRVDSPLLVAVNPVAKWSTKLWPETRFAALADGLIADLKAAVVFTGAPEDRPLIERIMAAMTRRGAANLAGQTTLKTLAALFQRVDLVVTTDTGPMHLAAAVETPVVALFGPTAHWRTGPFGPGHRIVRVPMACGPCFKRRCASAACMGAITVDMVMGAVRRMLCPGQADPKKCGTP